MFRYRPDGLLRDVYVRAETTPPLVLYGMRLFDGQGWVDEQALVVADGAIAELGPYPTLRPPPNARTLDLRGCWLVPGLVDCHAYPVGSPAPSARRFQTSGPILLHRAVADAHAMLAGGVTAVAQLDGGDPEYTAGLRDAVRTGLVAGPTVVSAGRALAPSGQRGVSEVETRLPGTGQPRPVAQDTAVIVATPDGLRKAARRAFVDGADLLSLRLSGPVVGWTDGELEAVTHEAQRVGGRVTCLATGNRTARAALRAGVDVLVLGPTEPDATVVELLAAGRTAWAPGLAGRSDGDQPRLRDAVGEVHARGGRLVVGTGWRREAPVPFAADVAALVAAGVPRPAALAGASSGGALALGLARGPLAAGEPANLVAFDADPLNDLAVLGRATHVRLIVHASPTRRLTPLQSILGVRGAG